MGVERATNGLRCPDGGACRPPRNSLSRSAATGGCATQRVRRPMPAVTLPSRIVARSSRAAAGGPTAAAAAAATVRNVTGS